MKEFNTTGLCNPKKHYMVDISNKLDDIKKLVKKEKYFVINRPRQYGKTTTLLALENNLKDDYLVISISFEGTDINSFSTPKNFCNLFIELVSESLDYIDEKLGGLFLSFSKDINSLTNLSRAISKFIKEINKEVILIIDEVDKSSDNQMFLFDYNSSILSTYINILSEY